jgi:hypothetical protein
MRERSKAKELSSSDAGDSVGNDCAEEERKKRRCEVACTVPDWWAGDLAVLARQLNVRNRRITQMVV